MKKLAAKLWAVLMLMLVSMQTMATDTFTSNRTDFRDESIYFMITTRFTMEIQVTTCSAGITRKRRRVPRTLVGEVTSRV